MVLIVELEMCSKGYIVVIILDVVRYLIRCKFSFKKGVVYFKLNIIVCICVVKWWNSDKLLCFLVKWFMEIGRVFFFVGYYYRVFIDCIYI